MEALGVLLGSLASTDNATRQTAENALNEQLTTSAQTLLPNLSSLICSHPDPMQKAFAAVLFRRMALKSSSEADEAPSYYTAIGTEARSFCETNLLTSLTKETDSSVRRKVCDTISEIARFLWSYGGTWNELLAVLFECTKSQSELHRESAFNIIAAVPDLLSSQSPDAIQHVLATALLDPSLNVRVAAAKATCYYLISLETVPSALTGLITQLLELLIPLVKQAEYQDQAADIFSFIIELAEMHAKLFKAVFPNLLEFCCSIMKDKNAESEVKFAALELILTIMEISTGMVKKNGNVASTIIPIMMEWMSELEDDQDWYTTEDLGDTENDTSDIIGEQALDRIARALGGKPVLPVAFGLIPQMLSSASWQHRNAALYAVSCIAEGCAKIMEAELDKIIQMITPHFRDPHPRVRYAAINAIGQMSTDFAPHIQNRFHQIILTNLLPLLDDPIPRLQAHAAAALVNFAEHAKKHHLAPHLTSIIQKLLNLLATNKMYLQEQVLTTIATIADSAEDAFVKFYDGIMPMLISIMRQAAAKEFRLVRGKAIECATLVALAVGKQTFMPHAQEVLILLRDIQQTIVDADDPQTAYLISAWARMCKVLGDDFLPYIDYVMKPLLATAKVRPDFQAIDIDEDATKFEEEGWEVINAEGQKYGIKTSVLDDKCTAYEMLICYARDLGASFAPFLEESFEIVLSGIKFYLHDGIRFASLQNIPTLFQCMKQASIPVEQIHKIWNTVIHSIVAASSDEPDISFLYNFFTALAETVEVLGANFQSQEQLRNLTDITKKQIQDFFEREKERKATRSKSDYDGEDEEQLNEDEMNDENTLGEISRLLHELLKAQSTTFFPFFDELLPALDHFSVDTESTSRQWAICIYDDLVEFCGPAAWAYNQRFSQLILNGLNDMSSDVRQAAAYGIGVFAQFGGSDFHGICQSALPSLFSMINNQASRIEENIMATENAISAIGKMCQFLSQIIDVNQVLPLWVDALPIESDSEEAPHVYNFFMELLESSHPVLTSKLPKVVDIITAALHAEITEEPLTSRMVAGLRAVLQQVPAEMQASMWSALPEQRRTFLKDMNYV